MEVTGNREIYIFFLITPDLAYKDDSGSVISMN